MASLYELTGDFLKVREMLFDEDADIEKIIASLFDMQRYLCCKMYDYGCMFGAAAYGRRNKLHRVLSGK